MNVTVTLTEAEARAISQHAEGDLAMAAQAKVLVAIEQAELHEAEQAERRADAQKRSAERIAARAAFDERADALGLGDVQREVLRSLVGGSYPRGGWVWDTHSGTVRRLEALIKKGLAEKREVEPRKGRAFIRYTATDAGREVVGEYTR